MNVAYVSNVVYPYVTGGAEKRIHEIGTRLVDRGHDVTVYGRQYWDGPVETTNEGLQLHGVAPRRELYVGGRRSIREAIDFARAVWRPLRKNVGEHDLIVASVFPYFPVFSAWAARLGRGTPLVTTWHECWLGYWREYLGATGFAGMAVERLVAQLTQYPVAVSSLTADRLTAIGPSRGRISVIPNGVDVESIRSVEPVESGFDILFLGRLVESKRIDLLLRAVEQLGTDVRLGIVGEGPESESLETLASELGLSRSVSFLGPVEEHAEVIGYMRASAVFVSPSTREGFGIATLEAMAAGCSIVAVDHPRSAASEVVGDAGFVVEPSPTELADGIQRALGGAGPARDPSAHVQQYDWSKVADQAEEAYRRAVEGEW